MIANELARQGQFEVCFLSLCEQKDSPFFYIDDNIKQYKLGERWIQPGLAYLPIIPKLRRFLKEKAIDIIIDIDIVLDCLSIPASRGLKIKVVSWEHFNCDYELTVSYRRFILKNITKRADYIITLTEGDKVRYGQVIGCAEKIEAIYNPMKERIVSYEGEKKKWIVTAVRLVYDKGIDYLTEIASKVLLRYPDWKWFVLGEGDERKKLEACIQEYGLEGRLVVPGLVDCVDEYLSKAKLFVLTSRVEGLPMCLLEAKTYKLPCISFNIPTGPDEIIEDEISGYLVEPFDCEKMINRISELVENEVLLSSFADRTKNNIYKFQMTSIMEKWNRVLKGLCE
ncbi:MAG: glycosyltransferase family 4 protein [Lachnospiraceae bacterium]|nr:glycosyltransferase family 4 protein [Lachnospiraceae bacterium]